MKTPRTTYVLIGLFFAGLLLIWGLDRAGVLTEAERNRRADRVLPDLIDANPDDVRKIEIDHDGEKLVFEKLGRRDWRMRAPLDVVADPGALENVFANLKNLRKSIDAGTLQSSAQDFGLDPPAASVRVWVGEVTSAEGPPSAALALGKTSAANRYVRTDAGAGIEVVDKRALELIDRPAVAWRETRPVPLSTFLIEGLTIHRPGLEIQAERGVGGQWRLTVPARFPADGAKVESALAALCSIRIKPDEGGFVAEGATDFAPFGLDEPAATIELNAPSSPTTPLILLVGKSPEDDPNRVYVRRADQDEVALVDARFLSEIPDDRVGFRGQNVAQVFPQFAERIEIQAPEGDFEIVREGEGWELKSPRLGPADPILVEALLGTVDALQTSEFLDPKHLRDAGLDPPVSTLRIWQREPDGRGGTTSEPAVALEIGNHDILKKTVYARIPGDSVILALPDSFLSVLPKTSFAFGDLSLPAVQPERVDELTITRGNQTIVLQPDAESKAPNQWRMVAPVKARADAQAVATALATLTNLRAVEFVAEEVGPDNGARFGLNAPELEIRWRYGASKTDGKPEITTLRIGGPDTDEPGARYASMSGLAVVFTLDETALQPFVAEFHDPVVLRFPVETARRLILRAPHRKLGFTRREDPTGAPTDWTPDPGASTQGIDLSRFDDLVKALSQLRTARFAQYEGPIPASVGLAEPRLIVEVEFDGDRLARAVRLGASAGEGWIYATLGDGDNGAVFLMPAAAWEAMIPQADQSPPSLPEDVFAPG